MWNMTWQNLELHSKKSYSIGKFSHVWWGWIKAVMMSWYLILVINGILHIPPNLPIHAETLFCETKRTRSQMKAIVFFHIIGPRAIVSLPQESPEVWKILTCFILLGPTQSDTWVLLIYIPNSILIGKNLWHTSWRLEVSHT